MKQSASLRTYVLPLLGALVASWLVVANGLARRYAETNPGLALTVSPGDGRALAFRASQRIRPGATQADLSLARDEALGALRRDLTIASAFATLGSIADMRGQTADTRAYMTASDKLSHRVLMARLWLIQDSVAHSNIAGALRNFDIALRTSEQAKPLLFPVLGKALADDRLVPAITALLQSRPGWSGEFVYRTIASGVASRNLARVLERLHAQPDYAGVDLNRLLVARLVSEGQFDAARQLALPRLPSAPQSLVVDSTFLDTRGDPPFNWALTGSDSFGAQRIGDHAGLRAHAEDGVGGVVASQLLALPAGGYTLSSEREGERQAGTDAPAWMVHCGTTEQPLATLDMPDPSPSQTNFTVPPGCPFQWLRLSLRAHGGPGGQTLTVDRVQVNREVLP